MNFNLGLNMEILMIAILSLISHADSERRHHGAHVHGVGTIAIAFEKEKGTEV